MVSEHLYNTMHKFAHIVNRHPHMNVRMHWWEPGPGHNNKNDPNYWLDVAYGAYKRDVIDKEFMKEMTLALKALGADNEHLKTIIKELLT